MAQGATIYAPCAERAHYNMVQFVLVMTKLYYLQALATLKQKIRKYNKDFESGIESYRQNPVESDEEGGEEERGEDDDDEGKRLA